ncbi:UNKNOWN [Stylonychia lemnae]|uniref:Uncharacterized protein n=1 Tax=Stylonychia lemnae TaxID=5949 RepID=A0A078B9Y7_STYLE|nr:UNKNOWN [Stylonychia lemnae]|eukprot:CDW91234.1 UNKNOWN [Stylonychia lemnae]
MASGKMKQVMIFRQGGFKFVKPGSQQQQVRDKKQGLSKSQVYASSRQNKRDQQYSFSTNNYEQRQLKIYNEWSRSRRDKGSFRIYSQVNQTIRRIHEQSPMKPEDTNPQTQFQEIFEEPPPIKIIQSRMNSQGGSTKNLQSKLSQREFSEMMSRSLSKNEESKMKTRLAQQNSHIYDEGISSKNLMNNDIYPNHIPQIPSSQNELLAQDANNAGGANEENNDKLQPSKSLNQIKVPGKQDTIGLHKVLGLDYREIKYDAVKEEDSAFHQDSQILSLNDTRRNQTSPSSKNINQQSKINICSPDLLNVDYTDIIKLQRPLLGIGSLQDVQSAIDKIKDGKTSYNFGIRKRSTNQSRFSNKRDSQISIKSALSKTQAPTNNIINSSQLIIKSPKNERQTMNQTVNYIETSDYNEKSPKYQDYRERLNQSVQDTISIERKEGKPSKVQMQLDHKKNVLDGTLLLQATIHKTSGNTPQSVTFTKKLFSPKESLKFNDKFASLDVNNTDEQKVTIQNDKLSTNKTQIFEPKKQTSPSPRIIKDNSKKTCRSDKKEQLSQRSLGKKKRLRKQIFNKNKNAVQNALVEQDSLDNELQRVDIILPDYKTVNMQPHYAERQEQVEEIKQIQSPPRTTKKQAIQQLQQIQHSRVNQTIEKPENSKLYRTQMDPNKKTFQENLDHLLKELNQSASEFQSQRQRSNSKGDVTPNILYSNKEQFQKQYETNAINKANQGGMKKSYWIKDNPNYLKDYQEAEYNSMTQKPGTINTSDFGLSLGIDINSYSRAKTSNLNRRVTHQKYSNSLQNTRKNIEFRILKVKINQNTVKGDRSMFEIDLNQHFKLKSNFQKDLHNKKRIQTLSKQSSKSRVQSPNQNEISLLKALRESSPSQILDIFSNSNRLEQWKQIPQNSIKFTLNKNEVYAPNIIPIADHLRSVKKYALNQYFFGNRNQNTEVQQFNKTIMEIIGQQKPQYKKDKDITLPSSTSPKLKNQARRLQSGVSHRKNQYSMGNHHGGWHGQTNQSMEFKTPISQISQMKGYQTMTNHLRQSNKSNNHSIGGGLTGGGPGFYQLEGSSKKLSSFNQDIMGILQDEQSTGQIDNNSYLKQPRFNNVNQSQTGIRVSQTSHMRQRSSVLFKHQGKEVNQLRQSDKVSDVIDILAQNNKHSEISNDVIL